LQLFGHPENSEQFSIISVIIFEVNIVDEQKKNIICNDFFCFFKFSVFLNFFSALPALPLPRRPLICVLCQQTLPKRWFANVDMTSYCDVTNIVYPVTMTTIRHCSILGFGRGHPIKQSPRASVDLCTPLAPRHPLCGPQQSFNETSNILCNRLRSAVKQNV